MDESDIVVATSSFNRGGRAVVKGETFRASDPLVVACEGLFAPFKVDNEYERATAAPGEKRTTGVKRTKKAAPGEKQEAGESGTEG